MISQTRSAIGRRAAPVAKQLNSLQGVTASLGDGVSYAGGGALPMNELATKVIRLEAAGFAGWELAAKLRAANPVVIGRISKDLVNLDLRTVLPGQDRTLIGAAREALS
jgi:L-seryl-tRNA(Ser) seleniumtransferase